MDSAARFPAATAWIMEAGPETLSPPAKTPLTDVSSVTGSTLKIAALGVNAGMIDKLLIQCLPDGNDDLVGFQRRKCAFIIGGAKTPIFIKNTGAALELNSLHRAIAQDAPGSPAIMDLDTFFKGCLNFFRQGGHFVRCSRQTISTFLAPSRMAVRATSTATLPPPITITLSFNCGGLFL